MRHRANYEHPIRLFFSLITLTSVLTASWACGDPFSRGEALEEATVNGTGTQPEGEGDGGKTELSFTRDVYPILQSKCATCHAGAGFGTYKLTGVAATDYPTIKALVDTSSPADSKLLVRGITMAPLTAGSAEYETIKAWITQGAVEN